MPQSVLRKGTLLAVLRGKEFKGLMEASPVDTSPPSPPYRVFVGLMTMKGEGAAAGPTSWKELPPQMVQQHNFHVMVIETVFLG